MNRIIKLWLIIVMFLAACAPITPTITPTQVVDVSFEPNTLTPSSTATIRPTRTKVPTRTKTPTPTRRPTRTKTPSRTPSPTLEISLTPSQTLTMTPVPPTATYSLTPSITAFPTSTDTPTPSLTPTSSATPTITPTSTPSPTITVSPTGTVESFPLPAFPGAEGFGALTKGGRSGQVFLVTNLNDSGTGSLRACVQAAMPRICIFRVGGTIITQSEIVATSPFLTIAGQTATGGGITLRASQAYHGETLVVSTHDVIIRYVRFRGGASAEPNSSRRSMTINNGAYNVIVDHCSFSWGTDMPLLLIDGVHDSTIQWSIISEGLANSTHSEGSNFQEHSNGLSISGKNYKSTEETGRLTVHHNLIANSRGRNPQNAGYNLLDFLNNVVYNWGGQAFITTNLQDSVENNVIGNYFKKGPNTFSVYEVRGSVSNSLNEPPIIYVQGNIGPNRTSDTQPEENVVQVSSRQFLTSVRFSAPPVATTSATVAFNDVLTEAGVTFPFRDAVDKRVIAEVINNQGRHIDCVSPTELSTPIDCSTRIAPTVQDYTRWGINDPLDSKGWPILAMGTAPTDSDLDGMPDNWESTNGTNPAQNDSAGDLDGDGYTNIEEYINQLVD